MRKCASLVIFASIILGLSVMVALPNLFTSLVPELSARPRALGLLKKTDTTKPHSTQPPFDVIIRNGQVVDGSGGPSFTADVGIRGDRIAAIRHLDGAQTKSTIDASGRVVAPGFIDMLGQSEASLLIDNRSLSKLSQGITTEITGEGTSIAPQNDLTIAALQPVLDHYKLKVDWTTLDGYFQRLEKSGTPLNIGTYVGAGQIREAILGDVDRAPTPAELET